MRELQKCICIGRFWSFEAVSNKPYCTVPSYPSFFYPNMLTDERRLYLYLQNISLVAVTLMLFSVQLSLNAVHCLDSRLVYWLLSYSCCGSIVILLDPSETELGRKPHCHSAVVHRSATLI